MYHRFSSDSQEQVAQVFPWLLFTLGKRNFAVNSSIITSIAVLPDDITPIPESPDYIDGIITLRGDVIPLIELRLLFSMSSLVSEFKQFNANLDVRKQDHINWVKELEKCVETGTEFKLATDPHRCKFGIWYDNYSDENYEIMNHLRKIDAPHKALHATAESVLQCTQDHDNCSRKICLKEDLNRAKTELVPQIIQLIDEAKKIFKENFKKMMITLAIDGVNLGIVVDTVCSVEELSDLCEKESLQSVYKTKYISGIAKSDKIDGLIGLLNADCLVDLVNKLEF